MDNIIPIITLGFATSIFSILIVAAIISIFEKEKKAACKFLFLAFVISLPFFIAGFGAYALAGLILCSALLVFLITIFLPINNPIVYDKMIPKTKFDERDTMFARKDLIPGSDNFNDYYVRRPENKELDDDFRQLPGLLDPKSNQYHPLGFASTDASFNTVASLKPLIKGLPSDIKQKIPAEQLTIYIKNWSKKLGAVDCGITELRNYHLYSHKGRRELYGKKIENDHKYAIAFAVEMDRDMISSAPAVSTVMESAQQYFNSGAIAVQVAEFIRSIGYPATAHLDANYEVICPLVARDAGLGEIGRMGLLMTPKFGPRVRISVVTTNAPLLVDNLKSDFSLIDFCRRCQKCASVCPGQAISYNDIEENDNVQRWQINSESCYTFWCQAGTDCSRCMTVCPYSHPDNIMHNIVRKGIKHSTLFRKLAVKMDDYIYGSKPAPRSLPEWMNGNIYK